MFLPCDCKLAYSLNDDSLADDFDVDNISDLAKHSDNDVNTGSGGTTY